MNHPKDQKEAIAFLIEKSKRELAEAMKKKPPYTKENTKCVNNLYYSWDGWMSKKATIPESVHEAIESQKENWVKDGFILKQWNIKNDMIQILFKVSPDISPIFFSQRVKGRVYYAFRQMKTPVKFSRKVGFRSLGDNTREIVNNYLKKQVTKSDYIDSRYKKLLKNYTLFEAHNDLSEPYIKSHGRYWFNLHIVIVISDRNFPITSDKLMRDFKLYLPKIANKNKCDIAHFSIMPDHIHISLKGNPDLSPYEIGLSFINNLYYISKINCKFWSNEFYLGSFSEYTIQQIESPALMIL